MDATQALGDLTEISSQIEQVAIVAGDGSVLASTVADGPRAQRFAETARRLVEEADAVREGRGLAGLAQLEAATLDGSVFVVRDGDRMIAATTHPDPTVGLVFYDLKHCLRSVDAPEPEPAPKPKRKAPAKKKTDAAA